MSRETPIRVSTTDSSWPSAADPNAYTSCRPRARRSLAALAALSLAIAGCRGVPTAGERQARNQHQALASRYKPGDRAATLPTLDAKSTLETLVSYAMLNQPRVEAAYYDYAAAIERITVERSLPDPRLTLQLDVQDLVGAVMPGLMMDLPWMKKLRLRADTATAETEAKYYLFETAVLQAAFDVKRPYYQLYFLNERLRVNQETLGLLGQFEQLAHTQVEAGKATLQDVLRAQIEQERLKTEIVNLEDSRTPLIAQLKAALGLRADQPSPPIPAAFSSTPLDLTSDQLLTAGLARNPRLRSMEAEVRMAESGIRLARTSRLPDFTVGAEADVKASPIMARPSVGVTLPIWRDKIAAELAAAQNTKSAAQARLSSEQIQLAVEFADKSFMYREATRNLRLLADSLLPKARQALDVARSGYSSARIDFINLLDAERSLLEFQLAEVEARTRRELALAEISLVILGTPPDSAPVLPPASTVGSSKKP